MPIKTAVVGVGFQGQRHAEKFAALEEADLVYVVDIDADRAHAVASRLGVKAAQDFRDAICEVTAVVLATPTSTHFDISRTLLESGIHLLLEKPLSTSTEEARTLVDLAEARSLVFQVGHLERFNPVMIALAEKIKEPRFIEANRIAPFRPRGLDVSVVLDLMIHDIDLIHSIVQSKMENVDAIGRPVFSDHVDVANARLRFVNGCVANVTSSRISLKTERSLRIFGQDSYVSADLHKKTMTCYSKRGTGPISEPDDVTIDRQSFGDSDALMEQMKAFLNSVAGGPPPLVSGRAAMEALATAEAISDLIGA